MSVGLIAHQPSEFKLQALYRVLGERQGPPDSDSEKERNVRHDT